MENKLDTTVREIWVDLIFILIVNTDVILADFSRYSKKNLQSNLKLFITEKCVFDGSSGVCYRLKSPFTIQRHGELLVPLHTNNTML